MVGPQEKKSTGGKKPGRRIVAKETSSDGKEDKLNMLLLISIKCDDRQLFF